jgi:flavin-binding protein dodecin
MAVPDSRRFDQPARSETMANKNGEGVYRVIDVIGTSKKSWEDAAKSAVATASKSLRDLRIAEVTEMDLKVQNGRVTAYRVRLQLSFKYQA